MNIHTQVLLNTILRSTPVVLTKVHRTFSTSTSVLSFRTLCTAASVRKRKCACFECSHFSHIIDNLDCTLFYFFFFSNLFSVPFIKPLNIRPMPPPGQRREYQTESEHHPLSRIEYQHQNWEQCRNGQGTHRNITGCKEYNRKYNCSDQGDAHIQCEHETTGCRNAFAALKMHIKGIIVPENNAKSRDSLQNLRHITKSREQQISHNPNGKYCLQGIPKKDNIAGRLAQGSKGIGCSGIAAAVIADINSLE